MRIFHVLLMTMLLLFAPAAAQAQGAFGGGAPHIAAELTAESAVPQAGTDAAIAFSMTPEPGWHGYWQKQGAAGPGMTVQWTLPKGVAIGPLRYPVPATLLIQIGRAYRRGRV